MATQSSNKTLYWVIGVILLIVISFGGYKFWRDGQSTTVDSTNNPSTSPTTDRRHDNSGAGTDTGGNPIQDHLQHALQHIGL